MESSARRATPVRRALVGALSTGILLSGCSSLGGSPPRQTTGQSVPTSPDAGWAAGLVSAANGPVPVIVVDQFGYRTKAQKVAVLRRPVTGYDAGSEYTPGGEIELIEAESGASVFSAGAAAWNGGAQDPASGDMAWWFDFSKVTKPGRYFVADPRNRVRSAEFLIGDAVVQPSASRCGGPSRLPGHFAAWCLTRRPISARRRLGPVPAGPRRCGHRRSASAPSGRALRIGAKATDGGRLDRSDPAPRLAIGHRRK